MASFFTEQQSVDVREGLARRVKEGWFISLPPYGYLNVRKDGRSMVEPDPRTADNVRRIFELFAQGTFTLEGLIVQLRDERRLFRTSAPDFPRSSLHRILSNVGYCGIVSPPRRGVRGPLRVTRHTRKLFDQVQAVLKRKSKPHTRGLKPYLYRGMLRCGECGCCVTTETQKGHNYLHCTKRVKRDCAQRFVCEEVVSDRITQILGSVGIPAADADWMVSQLVAHQGDENTASRTVTDRLHSSLSDIAAKRQRLADLYVDRGLQLDEYSAISVAG